MENSSESRVSSPSVRRQLRVRFSLSEKGPRVLLALAALFILVASSSELWLSSENSFYSEGTSQWSYLLPCGIAVILFGLHSVDWKRISHEAKLPGAIAYGLISAIGDVLVMSAVVMAVYVGIGQLNPLDFAQYWKLFYLAAPMAAGEFVLSSAISRLLNKTLALEQEVKEDRIKLRKLLKSAQDLSKPKLPDSIDDTGVLDRYLRDHREEGSDDGRG